MALNKKDLEKMSGKLKSMEFDEKNIDLQKDAFTQLTEKISKETGLSIEDVLSVNNIVDDENRESRADVKNQQTEKIKDLKQKQIAAMKRKIESKDVPDHIAKIHFSNQEDFRKKFLEYFVGENNPELVKQYESADELKDLFESKFEDAERKHVGIIADELTPEASQMINDFQLPEELLVEDMTEEEFISKLKEFLKTKSTGKFQTEVKEHDDLLEKLFSKDQIKAAGKNKFDDYEKKHVGALERKLTPEIIDALEKFEISDAMAEEHMGASDFNKKMRSMLIEGNKKLKEVLGEHPELAEKIFENNDYRDKEEEKYEAYEKKHSNIISKKIGDSIATEIDSLEIPQEFLDQEMSPEEFQNKLFNNLASKNQDLQKEMRDHPNQGLDKLTRQQESVKKSLQKKQESLENQKTELTKAEILAEMNSMKFTPAEIGNESLHKDQNAFAEAFKGRFSPGLLNKIQKRGAKIDSFLQQQLKTTLYTRWENEHEKAEKEEKKGELLKASQRNPLPAELFSEDLDESQFLQKYFDTLADTDEELRDPKHQTLRNELFRDSELQSSLKKRFRNYLEQRGDKLLEKTLEDLKNIKYSPEETREDDFHNKPDNFAQFVLKNKISPETKALLDKIPAEKRAEIEGKLFQHAKDELYGNWLKEHEAAEKQDAKSAFIQLIKDYKETHTPEGMKDEFGSEEDFKRAMWLSVVANSPNKEWQESEHAGMIEELSKDSEINGALNERYAFYKEKFKEVAQEEIKESLKAIASGFSPEDIDNDDFHKNPRGFAEEMMKRLPQKLRKKLASLVDLENFAQNQFENGLYDQWERKHETAEDKKFTQELEEKILRQEMPTDFAQTHYEPDEFQEKWLELIKGSLSDDLKNEHADVLKKLLGKDRIQNAFAKKFEAYEEAHDKAMEEKFSQELALLTMTKIPPDMAQNAYSKDAFKQEWFGMLLRNASPELLEELGEHSDLRAKLFAHQRVQTGLEQSFQRYESEHDLFTETKLSGELITSVKAFQMPMDAFKTPPTETQFNAELTTRVFKMAHPKMQSLREKLLKNPQLKEEMTKKYQDFQKKNPEKKETEASLSIELQKLQKAGDVPAEITDLSNINEWTDEQRERVLKKLSPKMKEAFMTMLAKSKTEGAGDKEKETTKKTPEQKNALQKMEREVKRLVETGEIPAEVLKKDPTLESVSREELESMLENVDPQVRKTILEAHEQSSESAPKVVKKTSEVQGERPGRRQAMEKDSEKEDEAISNEKKSSKINPEEDVSLKENFQGDLDEVLDQDIGRARMNTMMKSYALKKLMGKQHRRKLFEKFFIQWSAQLKESEFKLFKILITRKGTTLQEAFTHMFTTPRRRLAVSRIRKFSPKVWMKFNQGMKYTDMKSADLLAQRDPKNLKLEKVSEKGRLMMEKAKKSEQTDEDTLLDPETENEPEEQMTPEEQFLEANKEFVKEEEMESEQGLESEMETDQEPSAEIDPEDIHIEEGETSDLTETTDEMDEVEDSLEEPLENVEETEEDERMPETSEGEEEHEGIPVVRQPSLEIQPEEEVRNISLQPEKNERMPIPRSPEKQQPTDPLKELEKFRQQLMAQFKINARRSQMQRTLEMLGVNIEPLVEMPSEETSEFLEALRIEMETNSMSLKSLLQKFIRFLRFVCDFEIPAEIKIPADTLERLVSNPGEVFKALNDYYFDCRHRHEKRTDITLRLQEVIQLADTHATLIFEVHKNEVPETCSKLVPCLLVAEEEKESVAA